MDESFQLPGSTAPVELASGLTIIAPGLSGRGEYFARREAGTRRDVTAEQNALDDALAEAGLADIHTIHVAADTPDVPANWQPILKGELAPDEMLLQAPAGAEEVQFAIYADEDGVVSFHLPEAVSPGQALPSRAAGAAEAVSYRIRLRKPGATEGAGSKRGLLGWLAKKVIKIVAGKLTEIVVGKGTHWGVRLWEKKARPQGFHGGKPDELLKKKFNPFDEWTKLEGQRSLLFIHGTTSSTAGAFGGLEKFPQVCDRMFRAYGDRVIGFDHHTLSRCVAENVIKFYEDLAVHPGNYEFDVICHSRGGLLARALKELREDDVRVLAIEDWHKPAGVNVRIRQIVFVATPNNGTDLAEQNNLPKALDRLANIANLLPDAIPLIDPGAILSAAAFVAKTALRYLPGLADQAPGSQFLQCLNAPSAMPLSYWAVQADWEPSKGSSLFRALKERVADAVMDRLFSDKPNDLVVPTKGVSNTPEFTLPPAQFSEFDKATGIHHTNFFQDYRTWQKVLGYLNVP